MKSQDKYWFLQERLIFGLVIILSLVGVFTWFSINEQEDPSFPYRNGHLTIVAPGMSASAIEDTLVQPFERMLASVDGLDKVSAKTSDGTATVNIELLDSVYDTDNTWQRVREKVAQAQAQYGDKVSVFELNDQAQDTAGVLLTVTTQRSLLEARRYALYVRDELYKLPDIRKIDLVGDPGEQIEVWYPQESMLELGISPLELAAQIRNANALNQAGMVHGQGFQSHLSSLTRIDTLDALKQVEIQTRDNNVLSLSSIAGVHRTLPPLDSESFWLNGTQQIGLSIVVPPDQLRVTDFGDALMAHIDRLNQASSEFQLEAVFFQPEWTKKRRDDLALSLLYSSIGVGLVLFALMSRKVAFVVTLTIPAIALSSIAVFGIWGGVLHQMSIAGLIISLGLMVDNSIVMSELISRYRDQGYERIQASMMAIKALYRPLATSTFTTIAAFVPMLLSEGGVADFIRMIPVVVVIAILLSYFYSLALLPTITNNLKTFKEKPGQRSFQRLGAQFARLGTHKTKSVLAGFAVLVCVSFFMVQNTGGEFFPKSNRNQAIIDIETGYGQSHGATLSVVRQVEALLNEYEETSRVISFVGHSGTRFYYNLSEAPNQANVARVVLETHSHESVPEMVKVLNQRFGAQFPSARVHAREIGQGPPIEAQIEVRVLGDDRDALLAASEAVFELVQHAEGAVDSRRGYVIGKPKLGLHLDEVNLHKVGMTRTQVSEFMSWRSSGLVVTDIPQERESTSVVLRDNRDIESVDANYIANTVLMTPDGESVALSLVAEPEYKGEAPVLTRYKGFNVNYIKADVASGFALDQVLQPLLPQFDALAKRYRVEISLGGELEETQSSNGALLKTLPVGAILLFAALILQFNSFRLAGLVMLTIPLAMVGVGPTLSLVGVSFGFMSVLGVLALTGIVVNTAIILIDSVVVKVKEDQLPLLQAIEKATEERFRPVVLTACTTIIGMIPLTSDSSPMWPPMAWTIIGGLVTSTLLTLLVLPALLRLLLNEEKLRRS